MKVLILGAGRVGGSLARALVNNNYDVAIVDQDKTALSALEEKLDIMTIEGHAAHPISIKKTGADEATTVIAVTSNDEVNIIACQVAKKQFNVKKTICRLSEGSYANNLDIFGENVIDMIISPEK
jgi:trk system potassium uptake protein TrkA